MNGQRNAAPTLARELLDAALVYVWWARKLPADLAEDPASVERCKAAALRLDAAAGAWEQVEALRSLTLYARETESDE